MAVAVFRGRPAFALTVLASAQFLLVLDASILGVALPAIQEAMELPWDEAAWVYNAYILAYGGCLLLGGRLADLFGPHRMLSAGMLLFSVASLAGGLAPTGGVLVAARAAQGVAGAVAAPTLIAILVAVFPDGDAAARTLRNRAFGVIGAVAAAGASAGFFFGGALTSSWGWRSVFLANVPVALGLGLLTRWLLAAPGRAGRLRTVPFLDAAVMTATVTVVVYLLLTAGSAHPFTWPTAAVALIATLLVVVAVVRYRGGVDRLIPRALLRNREIRSANLVCLLVNMMSAPGVLLVSLYVQQVLGFSPFAAGVAVLPVTLAIAASSMLANRLIRRIGLRRVARAGIAVWIAGQLWLSALSHGVYLVDVLGPILVMGAGGGLVFVAFTVAATAGAGTGNTGSAGGLLGTSHQFGAATGAALVIAISAVAGRHAALPVTAALTAGYRTAILAGVVPLIAAAVVAHGMPAGQGGAVDDEQRRRGPARKKPASLSPATE